MPGYEKANRLIGSGNKVVDGRTDQNYVYITSRGGIETELRGMGEGVVSSRLLVSTSATSLPPSPLLNRKSLAIYVPSDFTGTFYIGGSAVNADNGFPILAGTYFFLDAETAVYGYATSDVYVRLLEGA